MRFRPGYYEIAVSEGCARKLRRLLQDAPKYNASTADVVHGLTFLRDDISTGRDISDLDPLSSGADDFAATLDRISFPPEHKPTVAGHHHP